MRKRSCTTSSVSPRLRVDARVALLLEQRLALRLRRSSSGTVTGNVTMRRGSPAAAARARQLARDGLGGVAPHRRAAAAAVQLRAARVQQLQVIVELGHRADRRARRAHRIGLVDRDRGRDAFDRVDLRLVHAVEELARVRRERLDVAALAFGVQRVEDERRLAAARNAGDDDQLVRRQLEREVLEIVLARAADDDRLALGARRTRRARVAE